MAQYDWKPPFIGLINVTGEPDTGKTTFCLTVPGVKPEEICFFDDDLKGRTIANAFAKVDHPFWAYHDLVTEFKESGTTKPIDFYRLVMGKLNQYLDFVLTGKRPQPKVVVFDNWSRMETAIRAYSETIMSQISDLSPGQQRAMSQMTWGYTYEEYARILGEFMKLAPMFFITMHVKERWMSPGVLEARGQRPLLEKSLFRVWLRHNPDSPAPIGLVLKRIQRMMVTDVGITPVSVLPRRVKPCTWETIYQYLETPIGDRSPSLDETPTDFELSILDGTLTADQKNALHLAVAQTQAQVAGEDAELAAQADLEMSTKARELKASGMGIPAIVKELGNVTPLQVAGWVKGT
jgi:hypothetical protein